MALCEWNLSDAGVDYLISPANTITFTLAPLTGSGLYIDYITETGGNTFTAITTEVPSGVVDGTNVTFNLSQVPGYLMLQQNQGLLQPGIGFTRSRNNNTYLSCSCRQEMCSLRLYSTSLVLLLSSVAIGQTLDLNRLQVRLSSRKLHQRLKHHSTKYQFSEYSSSE